MKAFLGFLRNLLTVIGRGFLLGLGFSLALGGTYLLLWQPAIAEAERQMDALMSKQRHADKESLEALSFSELAEVKHDGLTSIVGKVQNSGKETVVAITIQAQMFNKGKYVDQYSTPLSGMLGPGDSQYFKISCGCDGKPPAEHDSFKVIAVSGF